MTDSELIEQLATQVMGWPVIDAGPIPNLSSRLVLPNDSDYVLLHASYSDADEFWLYHSFKGKTEGGYTLYGKRKLWNPLESIADAWMLVRQYICNKEHSYFAVRPGGQPLFSWVEIVCPDQLLSLTERIKIGRFVRQGGMLQVYGETDECAICYGVATGYGIDLLPNLDNPYLTEEYKGKLKEVGYVVVENQESSDLWIDLEGQGDSSIPRFRHIPREGGGQ